jgi:hypothetical protein
MLFWRDAHWGAIPREGMVEADGEDGNENSQQICRIRIKSL